MALLFGPRGGQGRSQPKSIVEFRAGKMTLKGNMVHPDKRKGQVYVYQSDDQLTHFCWKDRTSGVVEDDLIIFPEDAVFTKVTQCKDGARVVLLKFKASSRKLFFWMQEPKGDNDDELISKVNEALNNPGGGGSSSSTSGRGLLDSSTTPSEQEMQTLLQSMNQSQLMQLIGGMSDYGGNAAAGLLAQLTQAAGGGGGSGGTSNGGSETKVSGESSNNTEASKPASKPDQDKPASSSGGGAGSAVEGKSSVQLEDLQKILSGIQPGSGGGGAGASVDLAAGVNSDFIKRITASPKTVQKLTPLLPRFGFPGGEGGESEEKSGNSEEVVDTLISPAFQHALSSFCSAFPSGQLGPLIEQFEFGKDAVVAARNGNLEAFLNAVQKEADGQNQKGSAASTAAAAAASAEEQKPEDMNVD